MHVFELGFLLACVPLAPESRHEIIPIAQSGFSPKNRRIATALSTDDTETYDATHEKNRAFIAIMRKPPHVVPRLPLGMIRLLAATLPR